MRTPLTLIVTLRNRQERHNPHFFEQELQYSKTIDLAQARLLIGRSQDWCPGLTLMKRFLLPALLPAKPRELPRRGRGVSREKKDLADGESWNSSKERCWLVKHHLLSPWSLPDLVLSA